MYQVIYPLHFTTDDRNRHLTADRICTALRVHSLAGVVFHPLHKSHPEPGVCTSACGCGVGVRVCTSLNINRGVSHVMWPVVLLR